MCPLLFRRGCTCCLDIDTFAQGRQPAHRFAPRRIGPISYHHIQYLATPHHANAAQSDRVSITRQS